MENIDTLRCMFPTISVEEGKKILFECKGDINMAIDHCLNIVSDAYTQRSQYLENQKKEIIESVRIHKNEEKIE